jgi:hypothetical protein
MGSVHEVGGHCPTCGAEYRPGFDTCADDGTRLVPGPAPDPIEEPVAAPEPPSPPPDWRELTAFNDDAEARLLTGRLEAEGIPARIFPERVSYPYGRASATFLGGPVRVMVPEEHLSGAADILREIEAG